jgi:hypothetical protein
MTSNLLQYFEGSVRSSGARAEGEEVDTAGAARGGWVEQHGDSLPALSRRPITEDVVLRAWTRCVISGTSALTIRGQPKGEGRADSPSCGDMIVRVEADADQSDRLIHCNVCKRPLAPGIECDSIN